MHSQKLFSSLYHETSTVELNKCEKKIVRENDIEKNAGKTRI